jgi:hypothetical protein
MNPRSLVSGRWVGPDRKMSKPQPRSGVLPASLRIDRHPQFDPRDAPQPRKVRRFLDKG